MKNTETLTRNKKKTPIGDENIIESKYLDLSLLEIRRKPRQGTKTNPNSE